VNEQRETYSGSLVGFAFVWFINSAVSGIALFIASLGLSFSLNETLILEAILFVFVGILNIIAVLGTRKGKLLTIVRSTAIAGNAMFIVLGVQAILNYTIIGMILCIGAAAANVVAIVTAPSWRHQQDMICPECDYDLRGLRSRGCPECGWERKT